MVREPRVGRRSRAIAVLLGAFFGVGAFTLHYAKATSYLSSDPAACANCHIMERQYDGWLKSSHHAVATCADCHLPNDLVGKYLAKALNGYHHSKAFTLQDFEEPIRITPRNAEILEASCLGCHEELVHGLTAGAAGFPREARCVHCHRDVGHGEPVGLGGPERAGEKEGAGR